MHIYSKYNKPANTHVWQSSKPTATVPDQSLSVQDLLERFTSGLLTPGSVWHEDVGDDFSDLDNPNPADRPDFDLVDKEELRIEAQLAQQAIVQQEQHRQRRQRSKNEEATKKEERSDDAAGAPEA